MQVRNMGDMIDDLPHDAMLTDRETPTACKRAMTSWRKAQTTRDDTRARLVEAMKAAAAEFVVFKESDRQRYDAEVRYATRGERDDLDKAQREIKRAAGKVVETFEEHWPALEKIGARLALEAYAVEVDSFIEHEEARMRRVDLAPLNTRSQIVPPGPRAWPVSDPDPLGRLDEVNALGLSEVAEDRCGLIEIVGTDRRSLGVVRLLTTPRRAAMLTAPGTRHHGSEWERADEIDAGTDDEKEDKN